MKTDTLSLDQAWDLLNSIPDPEVPVISIVELGVVRDIAFTENGITITMTPTYSGCPALKAMEDEIRTAFGKEGIEVSIKLIYKPAWTTDWLSDATKQKLEEYGIAPPQGKASEQSNPFRTIKTELTCPFCKSANTKLTSQFGSTACKALYFCNNCNQPFEHFKCH